MRDSHEPRIAGGPQGWALVCLGALPTMAIVSLVPNLPLMLQVYAQSPGAEWLVPMVMTIPSLCIATCSPLAGAAADRWGRRPVLMASLVVFTVVGVMPVFATSLSTVLATRFAVGLAEAGIMTTQNVLMGDYFQEGARERWLGTFSICSPIFGAAFVLAGGHLGAISWKAPFLLYLLGIPMLVWVWRSVFEPEPQVSIREGTVAGKAFWAPAMRVAVVTLVGAVLYFVQALQLGRIFAEHGLESPARISLFVTVASLGVLAGGWLYPRMNRCSTRTKFALVLASFAAGYAGLGIAGTATGIMPAALLCQLGNGLAVPALVAWALDQFAPEVRGRGIGLWAASFFCGSFLSPPVITVLQMTTGSFLSAIMAVGGIAGLLLLLTLAARAFRLGRHA